MKKLYSILALLLIAFTFGGCTLSMEEWLDEPATGEVPEEKRGVDAPYTETIPDVITVTYKYNPGVRPVTTKHRGYLAHIEADTIIYFYDNMPKDLLPLEGEYLAAGITPQFPNGLNHRVLAVSHEGGLYKVVTTFATVNEVYDDLVYELDLAYNPSLNDYMEVEDTTEIEYSNGTESEPIVVVDWSIYNKVKGLTEEDIKFIKRSNTRSIIHSEPQIITRGGSNQQDTTSTWGVTFRLFDYNLDDEAGKNKYNWFAKIFEKPLVAMAEKNKSRLPNNSSIYCELSYYNTTIIRGYSMVDKDAEYDKTYTETTEKQKFGIALGVDLGQRFSLGSDAEDGNIAKSAWDKANKMIPKSKQYMDALAVCQNLHKMNQSKSRLKDIEIPIKIGAAVPVEMVFKFGFDVEFKFNGNVAAYHESGTVKKEGYEYNKGKKEPIQEKRTLPDEFSIVGSGSLSFSLIPNASVGIRFVAGDDDVGALGCEIGADGVYKVIEATAEIGTTENLTGSIYTDANIKSSFTINPYISFYASLFGWDLWSQKIAFDKSWTFFSLSERVNPELYVSEVPGTMNVGNFLVSLDYGYGVRTMGAGLGNDELLPRLALFKNDIKDANLIAHLEPNDVPANEAIKKYGSYCFRYEFDDNNPYDSKNKYIAVPALYDPDAESYTYYTNHGYVYQTSQPKLKIVGIAQESATEAYGDFNFTDEANYVEYKFAVELEASATKVAKDYGIMVDIPKLGIVSHMISLKKHSMYSVMTNVVSVSFFSDYVAEDWNLKVEVSPYVVNDKGIYTFGEGELLEMGYPLEYQKYKSENRSPIQINASIE